MYAISAVLTAAEAAELFTIGKLGVGRLEPLCIRIWLWSLIAKDVAALGLVWGLRSRIDDLLLAGGALGEVVLVELPVLEALERS